MRLYELQRRNVIGERNVRPRDALPHVLLLLQTEHVLCEQQLELLVSVVDAQLFEAVYLERLESVYVQHPYRGAGGGRGRQGVVNDRHQPPEQLSVQELCESVSAADGLPLREGLSHVVSRGGDVTLQHSLGESLWGNSPQTGAADQRAGGEL